MNLIDTFLAYVEPLKGSKLYYKWAMLTVVSAMLERRVWLDRGRAGIIFPNLYTLLVGPPATGKSFAADQAVDLFKGLIYPIDSRPICLAPTKITQAALYQELFKAERELKRVGAIPVKQCPIFIYASELARCMVDFGGGTLTNELVDFYDSKSLEEKTTKFTIHGDKTILHNPSITMLGCTPQSFLQQAASENLISSGLSSRILFVVENSKVFKQYEEVERDKAAQATLKNGLMQLFHMQGIIRFNEQASAQFKRICQAADDQSYEASSEFVQNYLGRKSAHISKIAMLIAAMESRYLITESDILLANQWLEEIEPNMLKAFGMRSIELDDNAVNQLIPLIPYIPQRISKSELFDRLQSNGMFMPHNGKFDAMIKSLKTSGWVQVEYDEHNEYYARRLK